MKSSLWIVIVLVTGIVGFLVGYSVSSSTGSKNAPGAHATGGGGHPAVPAAAAGYGGAEPAAATKAVTGGYK